jgi:hypothetical protein
MHRFFWDVRYQPLPIPRQGFGGGGFGLPISATPYNTPPSPTAPFVSPGSYTVRLIVGGKTHAQPIVVKQDPRVKTPAPAMKEVYALTDSMYFMLQKLQASMDMLGGERTRLANMAAAASREWADSVTRMNERLTEILEAPAAPDTSAKGAPLLARRLRDAREQSQSATERRLRRHHHATGVDRRCAQERQRRDCALERREGPFAQVAPRLFEISVTVLAVEIARAAAGVAATATAKTTTEKTTGCLAPTSCQSTARLLRPRSREGKRRRFRL